MRKQFRVVRCHSPKSVEEFYRIKELVLDEDGTVLPLESGGIDLQGGSLKEVQARLRSIAQSINRPVLRLVVDSEGQRFEEYDETPDLHECSRSDFEERVSVALEFLRGNLGAHGALQEDPKLRRQYKRALKSLQDLCEMAGEDTV